MSRTRTGQLLLAGCAAAALAACGHTRSVSRARIAQISETEYRLSPGSLRVSQGPVTLVVHDFGRLAHNLAVIRGPAAVAETAPIQPGGSVTLSIYLAPGSYMLASTLFDDQSLGIHGKLTVTS